MKKVNFFIVGAAKAGTTSIFDTLDQHPQIFFPNDKEPHFFGDQRPRGKRGLYNTFADYMKLFGKADKGQLCGEASTAYLYSETAPVEIYRHNPDAKILILLRNPVDRAYSLYWHHRRDFTEHFSFEDALDHEERRISEKDGFGFHYLKSGFYHDQIERYLKIFGEKNVKVILFEEICNSYSETIQTICDFLSVEVNFDYSQGISNKSGVHKNKLIAYFFASNNWFRRTLKFLLPESFARYRIKIVQKNLVKSPPMRPETHAALTTYFTKDLKKLEKLLNKDLSHWYKA